MAEARSGGSGPPQARAGGSEPPRAIICAGCALLCDDAAIVDADGAPALTPPCPLGTAWLAERAALTSKPAATVDGAPASVSAALARAAQLLREARRPLLCGFAQASVEDVRAALVLAERLRALLLLEVQRGPWPGTAAEALRGYASATLGEVRDRSQLIVIWREDPERTHPRLLERLGIGGPPPRLAPGRTLVVVDDRDTATAARAQLHLELPRERDLEALAILGLLARGRTPSASELVEPLRELHARVEAAGHVAFVHGAELTGGAGGQRRALALYELVRALARRLHAVTLALPISAGERGAREVLAWQTGYGTSVDFATGHPEPVLATRASAAGESADVVLAVEQADAYAAADAALIALSSVPPATDAAVWIRTAALGVQAAGTAHRLDGVPLTLRAPMGGDAASTAALLARLTEEAVA